MGAGSRSDRGMPYGTPKRNGRAVARRTEFSTATIPRSPARDKARWGRDNRNADRSENWTLYRCSWLDPYRHPNLPEMLTVAPFPNLIGLADQPA